MLRGTVLGERMVCLARERPLLVVPAMNRQIWWNAATQRNVAQLAAEGIAILGSDTGELARKPAPK
jgi:phosphopantothenoylcysteine decarboxylase/phosphopantothenate--cysteine ligase